MSEDKTLQEILKKGDYISVMIETYDDDIADQIKDASPEEFNYMYTGVDEDGMVTLTPVAPLDTEGKLVHFTVIRYKQPNGLNVVLAIHRETIVITRESLNA